jgi:light-harvesting complex I chlorophyll a/b binding protein 4
MLSIAAASSTSFAAPSAMAVRSARTNVMMQEAAPVEEVVVPPFDSKKFAESLPGITGPLGFFDPLGFCTSGEEKVSEAKIRFYREVELKHARVAMLAAVGFPLAEQFHPLFATDDAPSFLAFQQTPLQTFWPVVVGVIAIAEVFSVFTFQNPASYVNGEPAEPWTMRLDHQAGDLGFDPMGLKPTDAKEFAEMQTKELNNGRLAMIAIAGMVVQEGVTGAKLF